MKANGLCKHKIKNNKGKYICDITYTECDLDESRYNPKMCCHRIKPMTKSEQKEMGIFVDMVNNIIKE